MHINLPHGKMDKIRRWLDVCAEHLDRKDARFFADLMPRSELWRLYPEFKHKTAFVDIETAGLSPYYDKITLVGICDGRDYKAYIAGHNALWELT